MENNMLKEYKNVPVLDLIRYKSNSRTHSTEQVQKLVRSIKEFGFTNPLLIDEFNVIIAGHGRLDAALAAGITEVPCIVLPALTEAQKAALVIADNKIALDAGWDMEILASQFDFLKGMDFDLTLTGFELDEIVDIFPEEVETFCDEDEVPETPKEPMTRLGDVWLLGEHRLVCGDSTSIDTVEKLMDGCKADLVFTDPPYGISYSSDKYAGNKKGLTNKRNNAPVILGDEKPFNPSFILENFKNIKEIFIWGFQYYPEHLGRGGLIVWNKKNESEAKCPHGDFEICWSKQERNKMIWLRWGGFNNKEENEDRLHTTQKPISLVLDFLTNWGSKSSNILDLFGGSGSTLIACEKLKRRCFMAELSPTYCDVIIQRWEKFTGKDAIHEETGKLYKDC